VKKIKIIHVLDSLGVGGLEKGVVTLVQNASDGFEHSIICMRKSGTFENLFPQGTQIIDLKKPSGNSLGFIWHLSRLLKSLKPDIVHTRNWSGMDAILAAKLAGIRNVVQGEHGWDMVDLGGSNSKRRLIRQIFSFGVKEYTCVSEQLKTWLTEMIGVKQPVTKIFNGIDTVRFTPTGDRHILHKELGLSGNATIIGIVARLDPIKNHKTLFKAFGQISKNYPDAHLVVIGGGPEFDNLTIYRSDRIHLLGERLNIPDLMRCFDVFVLPSLNEGISNTILEAMACGLPVIASRAGGNIELVKEGINGMLFPPTEVEALCECLGGYIQNPELQRQHGQTGHQMAVSTFTIKNMVQQYENVWRRLAI